MRCRKEGLCMLLIGAYAALILLANLGLPPLWGSEGRWAVIARSMLTSGDIFNPQLGDFPYWDKPLLSYWQILPGAFLIGGVSEFTARLPSVIWALIMLLLTYDLARQKLDANIGLLSAILLGTMYGFVFWGRNAQVEMTNAAFILIALWYFLRHESDQGHAWFPILGVLLAIGANLKGLTAVAVPVFCILLRALLKRDWSWLPPRKILAATIVLSGLVFLLPPLLACLQSATWEPLRLVWKENVVRFFQPFDHTDTILLYCYRIFDLAAPWSLYLPLALVAFWKNRYHQRTALYDVLIPCAAIFLFFTLSGSRRPYYLLPILPFVAILVGDLLARFLNHDLTPAVHRLTQNLGLILSIILAAACMILILKPTLAPPWFKGIVPMGIGLFIGALILAAGFLRQKAMGIILPVAAIWGILVLAVIPQVTGQPGNIRTTMARVNAMHRPVAFLESDDAKTIFYLTTPYEIVSTMQQAYAWASHSHGVLITYASLPDPSWNCLIDQQNWKVYALKDHPGTPTQLPGPVGNHPGTTDTPQD